VVRAYDSCRNRHCPKSQGAARAAWVAARRAELLPVPCFHVVFTLPRSVRSPSRVSHDAPPVRAPWRTAVVYGILFRAAAETLRIIAADPRHLGAEIGGVAVLHSWGQAMQHHPHVHRIVPGGGLAPGGVRWIACPTGFFLSVRVLAKLFRRLFPERLAHAFDAGALHFFGELAPPASAERFAAHCAMLRGLDWAVHAKRPFGGPEQVLAHLGRCTHRVAIANSRLVGMADGTVSFRWKDCRREGRSKVMTLDAAEFMRRFLLHVLPPGFHRIRHFGFMANGHRAARLARRRRLLAEQAAMDERPVERPWPATNHAPTSCHDHDACPCCGGVPRIVWVPPRAPPHPASRRR
jgi:hypothetical protein